jgi:hypothetical protein
MIKWLFTNPRFSDAINKEILDNLLNHILDFVNRNSELYFVNDFSSLKINFYNFVYHKKEININNDEKFNVFSMKHTSDISDLYLHLKNIAKSYNSQIFHHKNNNSYDLLCFIFQNIDFDLIEQEDINDNENEDEYN